MTNLFRVTCLLGALMLAYQLHAEDWPVARGNAEGTGVATSTVPDSPELLWKYEPGETSFQATPVIAGGVVYLGDADGGFHAVALSDGAKRWSVKFEDTGFLAAAAVKGDRLVVGDLNGTVRCLSTTDGAELWKLEAETEVYAGPAFYGEDVLVTTEGGVLLAINLTSGKEHWRFPIDAPLRCTPTIVEGRIVLAGCDARLHAVDATSGAEVSSVEIGAATGNTAAMHKGRSYFGTEGGEFLSVNAADKLSVAWNYRDPRRGQGIRTAAAVNADAVVYASQGKVVFAINPDTGEEIWRTRTRSRVEGAPVIAADRVILGTVRGRILMLDLKNNGEEIWQYDAGGAFVAGAAVVDGRVLIANDDGVLYCFGEK